MPDVDIVIVNYRSAAHTAACVGALHRVAREDGTPVEAIIVNNGDARSELEAAVAAAGPAAIVHNADNLGFGAACNIGAARGSAQFILFLNPDARIKSGFFRAMTAFFKDPASSHIGIAGSAIEDESGRLVETCSSLPSVADLITRSVGLSRGFLPARAHEQSGAIGQVMGAVFMIRRTLFQSLGGFDPRFFLYYEDVDLCARAASQGALTYYLTEARAVHIGRASSSHDSGMALALFLRSRFTYARLHFGAAAQMLVVVLSYVAELPLRLVRTPFSGKSITGRAVLRAYRLLTQSLISGEPVAQLAARTRARQ